MRRPALLMVRGFSRVAGKIILTLPRLNGEKNQKEILR